MRRRARYSSVSWVPCVAFGHCLATVMSMHGLCRSGCLHTLHRRRLSETPQEEQRSSPKRISASDAMENRHECTQDLDRRGADLDGDAVVSLRRMVLRRPGARSFCFDVSQPGCPQWRCVDPGRTNGHRAPRRRGSRVCCASCSHPSLAPVTGRANEMHLPGATDRIPSERSAAARCGALRGVDVHRSSKRETIARSAARAARINVADAPSRDACQAG